MNHQKLGTTAQGQAGVYRVASELIVRGHVPYFPAVDDAGVDLIADGSVRIQVKTTMRPTVAKRSATRQWPEGTLIFSLSQTQNVIGQMRRKCAARKFTDYCDIVVLWAIEPNRFWIVPAHLLNNRHTFSMCPRQQWVEFDIEQARAMRSSGLSYREIGERLDVSDTAVKRRFNKSERPLKPLPSVEVRKYEGRWDVIREYVNTARSANEVVRAAVPAIDRDAYMRS